MGWDGYKTSAPIPQLVAERLNYSNEYGSNTILAQSTRGGATYAAVHVKRSDHERNAEVRGNDFIVGYVVLHRRERDGTVMFKDMDETAGPFYYDCPKKILDMLTPIDALPVCDSAKASARKWRETCAAKRTGAGLPDNGQVLKFDDALSFGSYGTFDTFRVYRTGKKLRFAPIIHGEQREPIYRISHLENRRFQVVA